MNLASKLQTILSICFVMLKTAGPASAGLVHTITSSTDIAVTGSGYVADGTLELTLGFAPIPGRNLTVVRNTGTAFITGSFTNAPHGGTVPLVYNGVTYHFIANYHGGNGRSMVLHWPLTKISSWGSNQYYQLGNGGVRDQASPVSVRADGVLSGKTVLKIASGANHSFALTSDGGIFGWGDNYNGLLADNRTERSLVPVVVDATGVLAGKTLVDITASRDFSAVLDSTGKAYTWSGYNTYGELGTGSNNPSLVPVAVNTSGVLSGKSLVALSAGSTHMMALSSEGKVYAWGSSLYGELGNGTTTSSTVPVEVSTSGVLSGKTITSIAAGSYFSLALSTEGRVFAWGYGSFGQLGTGNYSNSSSAVAVDVTGALAGKTVVAIAARGYYALALTSEGKVYGWGNGYSGTFTSSLTPTAVDPTGAISGKTIVAISSSMALASDGMVFDWTSSGPAAVSGITGQVQAIENGESHRLALVDLGPPIVARHPSGVTAAEGATVTFTASAGNQFPSSVKWQVSSSGVGGPFIDIVGNPSASTTTLSLGNVAASQNGNAYRAVFSNQSGSSETNPAVLTLANWTATYTSPTDIPFQNSGFFLSGSINLQLSFAPVPGTNLMLLRNTGTSFIAGEFSNLPHGGTVALTFNGTTHHYIANYYGGNGRSLVLQWPLVRLAAWGENGSGELGDGTTSQRNQPVQVIANGSLAGKTVVKASAGDEFSMALTSEGRLFIWGKSANGVLGNGTTSNDLLTPFELTAAGPLAGKTIVSMAAGRSFCLALTREGRVYTWGNNQRGQLGVGYAVNNISTPVALDGPGLFGGKPVVAVSAGADHSLALTTDGRVYAWGSNYSGRTGIGTSSGDCMVPTEIATSEDLGDRPIVSIAAGASHSLVLAADGSLFAWGDKESIGNNGIFVFGSATPTPVDTSGVLSGKSVSDLSALGHNLVLASDGVFSSWGFNTYGGLGTGDTTNRLAPALVDTSGALAGKTVTSVASGNRHSLATTSDGKCFAWGLNDLGQLGNNSTTNSSLPAEVTGSGAFSQMTIVSVAAGWSHSLAILDQGPPAITGQPINRTAGVGTSVTIKAGAFDPFGYRVKWQISTTGASGPFTDITNNPTASTEALNLPSVSALDHNNIYRAVFSTNSGTVTTRAATLRIVDWTATLNHPDEPAFVADGVVASGTMNLNLGFAPIPGTTLTLVKNPGLSFITGTFSNIPQGGIVTLSYNGVNYDFVANYFGGNGRSLVLQWPWTKLAAWGSNSLGQFANGNTTSSTSPVAADAKAVLAESVLSSVSAGANHNLALTANGRVFAWGTNGSGQLGGGNTSTSQVAMPVVDSGVLSGKSVIAVAAGGLHSLALTSEGRVYSWGSNFSKQLGNDSSTTSSVPVAVDSSGALSGRTIVAIAAGDDHSLALDSDGRVYSWGDNGYYQLGNNDWQDSPVPVAVESGGALLGKTVVSIEAGERHSVALTSSGEVFTWGTNTNGQLGNNSTTDSRVPVVVETGGALAGKTVVAIAAGASHTMALTSDGRVFTWGFNSNGQLGDGSLSSSSIPVEVATNGILFEKSVVAIAAGASHSMALTSDGQVVAWGYNFSGQLGNAATASSPAPVAVNTSGVLSGRKVAALSAGTSHSLVMYGGPGGPAVVRSPSDQVVILGSSPSGVSLGFAASAVDVLPFSIQWQVSPAGINGPFSDITGNSTATTPTLGLTGINSSNDQYAYRAAFSNNGGAATSTPAVLTMRSAASPLVFPGADFIPFTAANPVVAGTLNISLGFAPTPGTSLTLIRNTGSGSVTGQFSNLPQGAAIPLTFGGVTHDFVANYFGGNGRSLVLQWASTRMTAWGSGSFGQLGDNSTGNSSVPVASDASGVLAGKSLSAISAGLSHSLALATNGKVLSWGANGSGQLGNNSTTGSTVPVEVDATGALVGKTVASVSAGSGHSLALASGGQVFAWGSNSSGRLGNGETTNSPVPVAVSTSGVLIGKTVTAIAAGGGHSLALTSEGKVHAWGANSSGQLGNNSLAGSSVPVEVAGDGVLLGKTVIAIAAGSSHSMALTSDGRVFTWGSNQNGQLGKSSITSSSVPVAAGNNGLISAGATVVAIAAGSSHSLALTSDGRVFAWGLGSSGQLGNGGPSSSPNPVEVGTSGVLSGKSVTMISAGSNHSLTVTSDGLAYAWGLNSSGQLGINSPGTAYSPVAITTASGAVGARRVVAIAGGGSHSLALCGAGRLPIVGNSPANRTIPVNGTVSFTASADGYPTPTVLWQQSSTGTGGTFSNITGNASATTTTLALTNVPASRNGYAYRAVFTNIESSVNSAPATLTVIPAPQISLPANITGEATDKNGRAVSFTVTANDNLDGPLVPTCNPPSGSTFPIGITTVNCSVTNSLGTTSTASFTITVKRTYAAFVDLYQLTDSDPGADPNQTGLANLTNYAFGMNPAAPDRQQLPVVSIVDGFLQISYPRWNDAADLNYIVELSDDLQTWNSGPEHSQQLSLTPIGTTRERVVHRDLTPVSGSVHRFIRVRITK